MKDLQKKIEELRDLSYDTGYLAAKAELGVKVDEGYQRLRIDRRNKAAAAIAEMVESEKEAAEAEGRCWGCELVGELASARRELAAKQERIVDLEESWRRFEEGLPSGDTEEVQFERDH